MTLAGLLLAMSYGPLMFIRYYTGDDWFFMAFKFRAFDWAFINEPISNHYMPLVNIIYYLMSTASDPTYFGNALLFYFSCMLVVAGIARVVAVHTERPRLTALAALSFAIWPSFEGARTYFSGGFWLALPVATFLGLILVVRRIVTAANPAWRDYVALAVLAVFTVLTSSQILIPLLYVAAYILPGWERADAAGRSRLRHRGTAIAAILIVPTVIAAIGRRNLMKVTPDFSGLIDGSYFTNLALFVKTKIGFDKVSATLFVCLVLYAGFRHLHRQWKARVPGRLPEFTIFLFLLTVAGMTMPKGAFNSMTTPIWIAGLLLFGGRVLVGRVRQGPPVPALASVDATAMSLCGLTMLMFFILQVGVGRRWGISTALADYYAMFPMAGLWFLAAGALSMRPAGAARREFVAVVAALGAVFAFSVAKYLPDAHYFKLMTAQRQFVRDLGVAACHEASALGAGEKLLLRELLPPSQCKTCRDVLWMPEDMLGGAFFAALAREAAEQSCPALAGRIATAREGATTESTGDSAAMRGFYARHYTGLPTR